MIDVIEDEDNVKWLEKNKEVIDHNLNVILEHPEIFTDDESSGVSDYEDVEYYLTLDEIERHS